MGIDFQKVDNRISQVEKSDSLIGGWNQPGKPREERKNHTHTHRHMEFAMAGANTGKDLREAGQVNSQGADHHPEASGGAKEGFFTEE